MRFSGSGSSAGLAAYPAARCRSWFGTLRKVRSGLQAPVGGNGAFRHHQEGGNCAPLDYPLLRSEVTGIDQLLDPIGQGGADPTGSAAIVGEAVSYTHLRAHETRHDLVCRL